MRGLRTLLSKVERRKELLMDDMYAAMSSDDDGDDDENVSEGDAQSDSVEEMTRDIVSMADLLNKLTMNRCVLNVKSVRNRTHKKRFGGGTETVTVNTGMGHFYIYDPPRGFANDIDTLLKIWGVRVDDEIHAQGRKMEMFDVGEIQSQVEALQEKYR